MSVVEAIILGIIQGLTEFLPVSSSGHLELAQALFGNQNNADGNLDFYDRCPRSNCASYPCCFS